jgi:hypothetical protein
MFFTVPFEFHAGIYIVSVVFIGLFTADVSLSFETLSTLSVLALELQPATSLYLVPLETAADELYVVPLYITLHLLPFSCQAQRPYTFEEVVLLLLWLYGEDESSGSYVFSAPPQYATSASTFASEYGLIPVSMYCEPVDLMYSNRA